MENNNSDSFDEIKHKKWIIPRIDLLHENLIKTWDTDAKQFQNDGDKVVSTFKEWRNIFLSALGGILTIFLAYNSVYDTEPWVFFSGISILITIIIIIFIIFTKLITGFENLFTSIDNMFQEGIGKLAQSNGFVTSRGAFLVETNYDYWTSYFNFLHLLLFANMINHAKRLRKLSKQYSMFQDFKKRLMDEAKSYEVNLHLIPEYYSKFNQDIDLPTGLLEYVNTSLKKYRNPKKSNPCPDL